MQQKIKQSVDISSMSTHKLNENMTIKTNSDKYIMLDATHGSLALKAYQQNLYLKYYY